ncbi:MAG: protein TolQ [Rickettsiales bacterium]|nr:protein TolQ [Rickettsiales bacterium]OUV52988.1 MAG: protein TolQ [Rickettsiales bacterium TMED127]|tara:strand:- start:87242 stop:87961 length:720 start_codon:yes stop_codon:yes gene_type:complete
MDETLEKIVLDETSSTFSLMSLFLDADIVVKSVIVILIFASIWSWTIIFSKFSTLKNLFKEAEDFEESFYSSSTLQKLSNKLGNSPTNPFEAIFFSCMSYLDKIKLGTVNKNVEFKKNLCKRIEKEMYVVNERELDFLSKNMNFLASVGSTAPFIGLFGTVWGIMNSFTAIGISQNTSLAVVAPGIAEALFATALGLVAAIPAVLAYNKLNDLIAQYSNRAELLIEEMSIIISKEIFKD